MSALHPVATSPLNIPSHSMLHRTISVTTGAPEDSISVEAIGDTVIGSNLKINSVAALGTAATLYLVKDGTTVKSRTNTQVATDLFGAINHDTLSGLNTGGYRHLTSSQYDGLTNAGSTTLHKHEHNNLSGINHGTSYIHLNDTQYTGLTSSIITSLHHHSQLWKSDNTTMMLDMDAYGSANLFVGAVAGSGLVIQKTDLPPKCTVYKYVNSTYPAYQSNPAFDYRNELGRFQFQGDKPFNSDSEHGAWITGYITDDWALNYNPTELRFYITPQALGPNAVNSVTFTEDQKLKLRYTPAFGSAGETRLWADESNILYLGDVTYPVKILQGCASIRIYSQASIPSIIADYCCFWIDTSDGNKLYLTMNGKKALLS